MSASRSLSAFAFAVSALAVTVPPALAGDISGSLPESGTKSSSGSDFSITNGGADGKGVVAKATGDNGIGIYGINTGTGFGGYFKMDGAAPTDKNSALEAVNSGGSKTSAGTYGSAGIFEIANPMNSSNAVSIVSNGTGSDALSVVQTGVSFPIRMGPNIVNFGGDAGFFNITNPNTTDSQTAILAINSGGSSTKHDSFGTAGNFQNTNSFNNSPAVQISNPGSGHTLQVVSTGGSWPVDSGLPQDQGNVAGFFEYNGTADFGGTAVYGANTATQGSAAIFYNTNPNNSANPALYAQSTAPSGIGILGVIGPGTDIVFNVGVGGIDNSTTAGHVGVYGTSTDGSAAMFTGGSSSPGGSVSFTGGSSWKFSSDRNLKEDFVSVDTGAVLEHLAAMPVFTYRFKGAKDDSIFLGPTAQDFAAAFHLENGDDTTISEGSALGVAFAAAKGLYDKVQADEGKIAALEARLAAQESAIAEMRATVARLAQGADSMREAKLTEH